MAIMDITTFNQKIADSDHDFECLTPLNADYVQFRFVGNFDGAPTIWDAHLYTLAYYVYEVEKQSQSDTSISQFIHVGDADKTGRRIEVGLDLPTIDKAAILKTIIMIRQYKRLAYGRHEYGETKSV